MKVSHYEQIESKTVEMPGAKGCTVRWLVDQADGAPNFAMRRFEVSAGGHTPKHAHPYEHEVYVLNGEGIVVEGDVQHKLTAGDVVFVQPNEVHQFLNTGTQTLTFLCLVPNSATAQATTVPAECSVENNDGA